MKSVDPRGSRCSFETLEELAEKLLQVGLVLDRNFDHYTSLLGFALEIPRLKAKMIWSEWMPNISEIGAPRNAGSRLNHGTFRR